MTVKKIFYSWAGMNARNKFKFNFWCRTDKKDMISASVPEQKEAMVRKMIFEITGTRFFELERVTE